MTVAEVVRHFQRLAETNQLEGVWPDIPIEVYNHPDFPGVRSSDLKVVHSKSFAHLKDEQSKTKEEKDHFRFGGAFHEYMELVPLSKLMVKYNLTGDESNTIHQMKNSILCLNKFAEVYKGAKKEITFIARDPVTGLYMRCRGDLWNEEQRVFADYKTTRDASPAGFQKSCTKYGYKFSAAYYVYIAGRLGHHIEEFRIFAVEKEGLLLAAPYSYYAYSLEYAFQDVTQALARYALGASGGHAGYNQEVIELRY